MKLRYMLLLMLTLSILIPSAAAIPYDFTFSDDFEDGNVAGWDYTGSFTASTSTPITGTYSGLHTDGVNGLDRALITFGQGVSKNFALNFSVNGIDAITRDVNILITNATSLAGYPDVQVSILAADGSSTNEWYMQYNNSGSIIRYDSNLSKINTANIYYELNESHHIQKFVFNGVDVYDMVGYKLSGADNPNVSWNSFLIQSGYGSQTPNLKIDNLLVQDSQDSWFRFTANNTDTGAAVNNFNISVYYANGTLLGQNTTTDGEVFFNMSGQPLQNYDIFFTGDELKDANTTITYNNNTIRYEFFTYPVPIVDFTFYDEITRNKINNVSYSIIFDDFAKEYTTTNGESGVIDLNNTGSMEIEYESDDYDLRHYYLNVTSQTNTSLDLYLLNEGNSTLTNFLITDEAGVNLEGAELSVLRRYILNDNSVFEVVEMAQSNNNGEGSVYLQQNDATYKFIVQYNGQTITTTNPAQIFSNSLIFSGIVGDQVTETLYNIVGLSNTLSYNDANLITTSWVDSVGVLDELCLYIYRTRGSGDNLLNSSCSTANTGSIVLGFNNASGNYEARVVASTTTDSINYVIDTLSIKIDNFATEIGVQGVFWTAVYVIAAATMAFYSPIVAIVLMIIGLIAASFMFVSLSIGTIMLIVAAAGFLLYAFRRGGA